MAFFAESLLFILKTAENTGITITTLSTRANHFKKDLGIAAIIGIT